MNQENLTKKEHLAFFLPGLYDGGAERIMLNLAKGMADRGYQIDLVLGRAEGPFMNDVPGNVRVIDLKASRVLFSTPALIKYIRQERPAALLSVLYANLVALWAKRLAGVPLRVILAEHNTLSSVAKGEKDLRFQLFPRMAGWFYPWADGIIAVSEGVAEDLAQTIKMDRRKIEVVYNPIVTPDLFSKAEAKVDHPWFEAGQLPVLLAVGRLTSQKGFDILLQAFALVRKQCDVRLIILGEGEDRAALEAQIKELHIGAEVSLPGFVSNPYAYIGKSKAFILSSRWEGLPTVLVEALALGTPIVSTDCPSGPREILEHGKYGSLVPVNDADELAKAILGCLESKHECPPKESWAPFAMDTVVDQYIRMLVGS